MLYTTQIHAGGDGLKKTHCNWETHSTHRQRHRQKRTTDERHRQKHDSLYIVHFHTVSVTGR